MARKFLISRVALAVALASGMTVVALPTAAMAKEKAPKLAYSKEFAAKAADIDKAFSEWMAAQDAKDDAKKAAAAEKIKAMKPQIDELSSVATTAADKVKLGEFTRNYGILTSDTAMQHKGLVMMLESGGLQPQSVGQVQFLAGVTAYQTKDWPTAQKYFQMAYDGGYKDPNNQLPALIADVAKRTGDTGLALDMAKKELASAQAAGTKPSETAIRTALQAAYDAKQLGPSVEYAAMLGRDYPSPSAWNGAISVVRALTNPPPQEYIDLLRLMDRTNSFRSNVDYGEFIDLGTTQGLSKEVLGVIAKGKASGLISADNSKAMDATKAANDRIAKDSSENLLAGYDRDAAKPGANLRTVIGAADSYLAYQQPAKAEMYYKKALGMPGVDKDTATMRMGIAQVDQGKYADAQATFAQVGGTRAPVAKLWAAYAASKAAPATTAAPAQ